MLVAADELAEIVLLAGLDLAGPQLDEARTRGWLEPDPDGLRPTELGRRFTNDVIGLFLRDTT